MIHPMISRIPIIIPAIASPLPFQPSGSLLIFERPMALKIIATTPSINPNRIKPTILQINPAKENQFIEAPLVPALPIIRLAPFLNSDLKVDLFWGADFSSSTT